MKPIFTYQQFYHYSLAIALFTLCCFPKLIGLGVIILLVAVFAGFRKKELRWEVTPIHLLLVGLYLFYLAGILFTRHSNDAWGYAENKLSFLLFPLIFSFRPSFKLEFGPPVLGLSIGVLAASIYGVIHSFSLFLKSGWDLNHFVSVNVSPIHHPTYFAFFIITAVCGCWLLFRKNEFPVNVGWLVGYSLFCGVMLLLCLSLASLIYLFLLIGTIGIVLVWRKFGLLWAVIVSILLPVLFYGTSQFIPRVKFEVNNGLSAMGIFLTNPVKYVRSKPGDKTGNEVRLVMWTATLLEINEHPLGVGTGNVDEHLSQRLKALGQIELSKQDENGHIRYNPHNQFLQTALEIGLIGLMVLIVYVIGLMRMAWKHKNWLLAIIASGLVFNALFESVLQRQSGIVFFSFWLSFLPMMTLWNAKNLKEK
jgi:O-antigen ligase